MTINNKGNKTVYIRTIGSSADGSQISTHLYFKGKQLPCTCMNHLEESVKDKFKQHDFHLATIPAGLTIEKLFPSQDASDLLTLGKTRSQVWVKNLPIAIESINNSVTCQLGISPMYSKSSYPRKGPVGYEEEKLPPDISVRYLFEPSDLEGRRRQAGDMNWSPKIYWLIDDDGKNQRDLL
ncbi:unnamed protein product [Rhizophagus irregularis]|nr:unnamed protein product [Rhizophagus irregularis]